MPSAQISLTMNDAQTVIKNAVATHDSTLDWSIGELNLLVKQKRKAEKDGNQSQIAILKSQIANLESQIAVLKIRHDEIIAEGEKNQKMTETIGRVAEETSKENESLKELIDNLQKEKMELDHSWSINTDNLKDEITELKKENAEFKTTNRDLAKELTIYRTSEPNGTTEIYVMGTKYEILRNFGVYQISGHSHDPDSLCGMFEMCESYSDAEFIHNGHKGFIKWTREGYPIRTYETNPSMNGLSH